VRVVLDTNVVASGLLWGGVPRQLLQAGWEQRIQLYTSPVLLLELADILGRAKFARKIAASQFSVDHLVERYALLITVIHPAAIAPTVLDDPDDDQVLACALAAKAELIVSGDRQLLDLNSFRESRIVNAAQAVALVPKA
jgi:hypothetical protein